MNFIGFRAWSWGMRAARGGVRRWILLLLCAAIGDLTKARFFRGQGMDVFEYCSVGRRALIARRTLT